MQFTMRDARRNHGHVWKFFVTRQTAEAAAQMSLPFIIEAMKRREVGESGFQSIGVMDPALPPGSCTFEEPFLYEHAIGDKSKWDADYVAYPVPGHVFPGKLAWMRMPSAPCLPSF